jgi:hypothetical protein
LLIPGAKVMQSNRAIDVSYLARGALWRNLIPPNLINLGSNHVPHAVNLINLPGDEFCTAAVAACSAPQTLRISSGTLNRLWKLPCSRRNVFIDVQMRITTTNGYPGIIFFSTGPDPFVPLIMGKQSKKWVPAIVFSRLALKCCALNGCPGFDDQR